jgi:murein L,D-transpeptidase YcbB/YkuD
MKRYLFVVLGLVFLAGCATSRATTVQSLGNRVSVLETKVQSMEAGQPSSESLVSVPAGESVMGESGVTVDTMTKKQIQQALKNAGYYDGKVDGKIGPKTKTAIREFQKNMGLKDDGVAGKNTKEKLLKYLPL